jgi:hypothetical protein
LVTVQVSAGSVVVRASLGSSPRILNICSGRPVTSFFKTALARNIHDDSSRNGGVERDKREERDSRDV